MHVPLPFLLTKFFLLLLISVNISAALEQAGCKLTIKDKKGKNEIKLQKEENTLKLKYKIAHHCGFPVTRILGQSEILIYLFYSVSHFTFTSSGAFHITLCSRMYPLFPPGD